MKKVAMLIITTLLFSVPLFCGSAAGEETKWTGIDESVVGKFAKELGREARDPFINTDQGDLLLFCFTFAGTVGGFIIGFYWHKIFVAGKQEAYETTVANADSVADSKEEI